ncbi:hypothetical protein [Vibrio cidicii]|uniref:hypothetical protein n=1 Tax=Vibrio cidicii TaxID=1763883 RepID=UPI0018C29924|nr:hypothetical protein [Vibrio cidicii]MBG0757696.1 hypothetical protein [Vibrio cidicii]
MDQYRTIEEYNDVKDALVTMCGMLLFEFAKEPDLSVKDTILRNFLAKTSMSLNGIFALCVFR